MFDPSNEPQRDIAAKSHFTRFHKRITNRCNSRLLFQLAMKVYMYLHTRERSAAEYEDNSALLSSAGPNTRA